MGGWIPGRWLSVSPLGELPLRLATVLLNADTISYFRWPEIMSRTVAHILYVVDERHRFLHFGSDWVTPARSPLFQLVLASVQGEPPIPLPPVDDSTIPAEFPPPTIRGEYFKNHVLESISNLSDSALAEALLERRLPVDIPQMVVVEEFVPKTGAFGAACRRLVELAIK